MKLLSHGIIKKGNLVKSPPLNSRGIKRWHKRYFIFYDSCRALRSKRPGSSGIEQNANNEADKNGLKKRRSKSFRDTVRRFTTTKKISEENNEKLEDLVLLYYESEEKERKGALPIGKILCKDVIVTENKNKVNGYPFVINIQTKERLFHLCAETEEEHKSWLKVFNMHLNGQRLLKRSESIDSLEDFLSEKNISSNDDLLHVRNNKLLEQLSELRKQRASFNSPARVSYYYEDKMKTGTFGYENLPGNKDSGYSDSTVLNSSTPCVSYHDEIDLNNSQQSSLLDINRKCLSENSIQGEQNTFFSDDIYQCPPTHSVEEISLCYSQTNPNANSLDNERLTNTIQNESNVSFSDLYQIPYRDFIGKNKEKLSQYNNESDFANSDHFSLYTSPRHSSSVMNDEIQNHRLSSSTMNDENQKNRHSSCIMNNETLKRRYSSSTMNDEIKNHRYSASTMNDEVQEHGRNIIYDAVIPKQSLNNEIIKRRHNSNTINNETQKDRSNIYENVTLKNNLNARISSCSNENSSSESHLNNNDFLYMNFLSLHDDNNKKLTSERKDILPNYQQMSSMFYSENKTSPCFPEHKNENTSYSFSNMFPVIDVDENVYFNSDELLHKSRTKNIPDKDGGDYMALDPSVKNGIEYDEDAPELPRKMSMHRRCSEPGKNTYDCKNKLQPKISCSQVENSPGFPSIGSELHWAVIEKTKYEDVSRAQTFSGSKEFKRPVTKSFK